MRKGPVTYRLVGLLATILVVFLLGVKMGWWTKTAPPPSEWGKIKGLVPRETYLEIRHGDHCIGLDHRRITPDHAGGLRLQEEIVLRLRMMGIPQVVTGTVDSRLKADGRLVDFSAVLSSPLYATTLRGQVAGQVLHLSVQGKPMTITIPPSPLFLTSALAGEMCRGRAGQTWTVALFDPLTMGLGQGRITHLGKEERPTIGGKRQLAKLRIEYSGLTQWAWCDEEGEVVREEGPMGLVLEQVEKNRALAERTERMAGLDVTELFSIPVTRSIPHPERLRLLQCRLEGVSGEGLSLEGGRQSLAGGRLRIVKEAVSSPRNVPQDPPPPPWTIQETPYIQVGHPRFKAIITQIIGPQDAEVVKVRKIISWVHEHMEPWPVPSLADSLAILDQRRGDCTEYAKLVAALARTACIPTAIEVGIVYQRGRFYYHAWNACYVNGAWLTADATFNQVPADCTHIRFMRGNLETETSSLAALASRLRVSIEELRYDPT